MSAAPGVRRRLEAVPSTSRVDLAAAERAAFHSLCMHHLLPFHGVAHVGYLPGDHMCMSLRGVQKPGTRTVTSARTAWFATIRARGRSSWRLPAQEYGERETT